MCFFKVLDKINKYKFLYLSKIVLKFFIYTSRLSEKYKSEIINDAWIFKYINK